MHGRRKQSGGNPPDPTVERIGRSRPYHVLERDLAFVRKQTFAAQFDLLRRDLSSMSRALLQYPGMLRSQAILGSY